MRSILEKMSERGLTENGEPAHLTKEESKRDSLLVNKSSSVSEPLDTAMLNEKERKEFASLRKMSREDLFQQAFGHKPSPRPSQIMVKLFLDEKHIGSVEVNFDVNHHDFWFQSGRLAQILDTLLLPQTLTTLASGKTAKFSQSRLLEVGFKSELKEQEFELSLVVPGNLKAQQTHDFDAQNSYGALPVIKPARVSAFVNLALLQDFGYRELFFKNDSLEQLFREYFDEKGIERKPFRGEVDGAINIQGWVLESSVDMVEPQGSLHSGDSLWAYANRGDTRLVHDWAKQDLRLLAGDVSANIQEMSVTLPTFLGTSLQYDPGSMSQWGMQKSEGTALELVLDGAAEVETFVNERSIQKQKLSSGVHHFKNIHGGIGENRVRVHVQYEDGRAFDKEMVFVQGGTENLGKGKAEYSFAAGMPRHNRSDGGYAYASEVDSLGGGGFVRYGLHQYVTGELYAVGTPHIQAAGMGLLWRSDSISQWQLRAFASRHPIEGNGYRVELTKGWSYPGYALSLAGSAQSDDYISTLYDVYTPRTEALQLRGSASTKLWKGSLSAALQTSFVRADSVNKQTSMDYYANASYGLSPLKGLSVSLNSSVRATQGKYYPQFGLSLSYFFNQGAHSFVGMDQLNRERSYHPSGLEKVSYQDERGLNVDTLISKEGYWNDEWNNSANGNWSWSEAAGLNGGKQFSMGGGWQQSGGSYHCTGFRSANYGQIMANYALSDNRVATLQSRSHYVTTRFETSLSFADGLFGIGRPIRNNYFLVNGQNDLSNTDIRVNPSNQYDYEYSRSWGPLAAVYGEIPEYKQSLVSIKLADAALGTWLDNNDYRVDGAYKRGYALRVGKDPTVLVQARLIDLVGDPVARVSFTVVEKDKPNVVVLESFTNKRGFLQAGNLNPGKTYLVKFATDAFIADIEVVIPKSTRGVMNLNDIKVKNQPLSQLSSVIKK